MSQTVNVPEGYKLTEAGVVPGGWDVNRLVAVGTELTPRPYRNRDKLWLLGSEIIRDIHETPKLRRRPVQDLVREAIVNDEGPLIHGGFSEQEQRSFDSTCGQLNRFLAAHADNNQL